MRVEAARCRVGEVVVPDYPGARPTGVVALAGGGEVGYGENVAFSRAEQDGFAAQVASGVLLRGQAGRVGDLVAPAPAFARAAVEAALVDLALRQAGLTLRTLLGAARGGFDRVRWVASFAARRDPASHAQIVLARAGGGSELKIDVAPDWSDAEVAALARTGGVVILDFKDLGTPALCDRLAASFPTAIFEDPPAGCRHPLVARDRPLLALADVEAALGRGEAINAKAPRMGGPLALLAALAAAQRAGRPSYLGGMFEVGPGREQARELAALFCADAPNDLGPIAGARGTPIAATPATRPTVSTIVWPRAGFGAAVDFARWP